MELPHAYTNRAVRHGSIVTKTYQGLGADERQHREESALRALVGQLPVPPLMDSSDHHLQMGFIEGTHGQELVDAGEAAAVLAACGAMLRRIHEVDPAGVVPSEAGQVLVHGDFGPNNVVLDPDTLQVVAVVDWEWAHAGDRIEDMAWCEWIVRMHHPQQIDALDGFFDAYGHHPPWAARQAAMVARQEELIDMFLRRDPDGAGVSIWRKRLAMTRAWTEGAART